MNESRKLTKKVLWVADLYILKLEKHLSVNYTISRKVVDILQIEYSKSAVKAINSMDKSTKQRIKLGIEGLTTQPPTGDIKPLQGYSDNRYRLRIGGYRFINKYLMDNSVVVLYIMDIGSRGNIYK